MNFKFQHFYIQAKSNESIVEKKDIFFDQSWKLELVAKSIQLYKVYQNSETKITHRQIWDLYYEAKNHFELFEPCYYSNSSAYQNEGSINADCVFGTDADRATKNQYHWNKKRMGILDPNLKELDTIPLPTGIPNSKRNGEGIYIALPDTGYFDASELVQNNPQFRPDLGWDIYCGDSTPKDDHRDPLPNEPSWSSFIRNIGHGTSTAGIIVGKHTSGVSVESKGLAKKSVVVPIRIDKGVAMVGNERLIRAIDYAINIGCKVISISMGYISFGDNVMNGLLKHATEEGIIICAAAAQFHSIAGWIAPYIWPANSPYAIAVSGSTFFNTIWDKSFTGQHVSVSAPAEFVYAVGYEKRSKTLKFDRGCGTSYATPSVAAAAANWYALYTSQFLHDKYGKSLTHFAFRFILKKHGVTTPSKWETDKGGAGILNFMRLLSVSPEQLPSRQYIEDDVDKIINQYEGLEMNAFLKYFNIETIEDLNNSLLPILKVNTIQEEWLKEYQVELFYLLADIGYNGKEANLSYLFNKIKEKASAKLTDQLIDNN